MRDYYTIHEEESQPKYPFSFAFLHFCMVFILLYHVGGHNFAYLKYFFWQREIKWQVVVLNR
jgi:hypothetical protein